MKFIKYISLLAIVLCYNSCAIYSFSGISIEPGTETFQVNAFENNSAFVIPNLERDFRFALQDLIQNQSSLNLVNDGGQLIYEGEIVDVYEAPQAATSEDIAAQNRLTITINIRYINTLKEDGSDDFEKRFTFFYDIGGSQQFTGTNLDTAKEVIFERITQDVFNESLAKW